MALLSTLRAKYFAHARGRARTPGRSDARTPGRRDLRFSPKFEIFAGIRNFRRNPRFSPTSEISAETQEFRNDPPDFRRDDFFPISQFLRPPPNFSKIAKSDRKSNLRSRTRKVLRNAVRNGHIEVAHAPRCCSCQR